MATSNVDEYMDVLRRLDELRSTAHFDEDTEDYLLEKLDDLFDSMSAQQKKEASSRVADFQANRNN